MSKYGQSKVKKNIYSLMIAFEKEVIWVKLLDLNKTFEVNIYISE